MASSSSADEVVKRVIAQLPQDSEFSMHSFVADAAKTAARIFWS